MKRCVYAGSRWLAQGLLSLLLIAGDLHAENSAAPPAPINELTFTLMMTSIKDTNEVLEQLKKTEDYRSGAEASLKGLLKSAPKDLELNLRFAELQLHRARDLEFFALELQMGGNAAKGKEFQDQSVKGFEKGLGLYKKLLPQLKEYPLEGEIYLSIARSMKSLGRYKEALALLKTIEHRTFEQKTNFFLTFTRGELEFALTNPLGAKEAYAKATTLVTAGSPEEMYLLYKNAWASYNLKRPREAINLLKKVIEANRDRLALAEEACRDYTLFVADLDAVAIEKDEGGVPGIYKYLVRYTQPKIAEQALESLAETYALNGFRSEAKATLEFLIKNNPNSLYNADRAHTIVKIDQDLSEYKALTERYVWLVKGFGPRSDWYYAQGLLADVKRNAYDTIELSLRTYAVKLHKESQAESSESRRDALEASAAQLYDVHLANFENVPRIHYYRAEIYRRLKDFENAAKQYDNFLAQLEDTELEKLDEVDRKAFKESTFASIEMWAKTIDKKPAAVPSMIKAMDRFLKLFPDDPKAATIALDAARVEYKAGNPDVALKRIQRVVASYPQSAEAAEGVNAGLDILNKQGDFLNVAEYARDWRERVSEWAPKKKEKEIKTDLDKLLTTSEAKICEELAKKPNKKLEAALCFRRTAENNPGTDIAPKALVLAANLFTEMNDPHSALDSLEILVQRYPNSQQAGGAFSKLAEGFERTFQFARAAATYDLLLQRADVPNRPQVVRRLAELYTGMGQSEKLEKVFQRQDAGKGLKNEFFTKRLKSNHDELLLLERNEGYTKGKFASARAQAIYSELKEHERAGKLPEHLLFELQRIEGHLFQSNGNLQKADELWTAGLKKFWQTNPKTPDLWESAARMRSSQGSYWRALFKSTEIASNPQKKAALFQKLEAWNSEVLAMNSPAVALETLWITAKLYRDFAAELKAKPATAKLGDDLNNRADLITKELSRLAQNWGVISPLMLSVLKELRIQRGEKNAETTVNFPWPELPRGLAMASEKRYLPDWTRTPAELQKTLQTSQDRREQRHLAYILLMKQNSIRDAKLNGWEELLTQQDEVQARIEASLSDNQIDRAEMLLSQYEAIYGDDLFSAMALSELDVRRRDYSAGYRRAIALFERKEFAAKYYAIGWKSLFDELIQGKPASLFEAEEFKEEAFAVLSQSAEKLWEKQLLATLCLKDFITCSGREYHFEGLVDLLKSTALEGPAEFVDQRSLWRIEKEFLETTLRTVVSVVRSLEQLENLKLGLARLKKLGEGSLDPIAHRKTVDQIQAEIDAAEINLMPLL